MQYIGIINLEMSNLGSIKNVILHPHHSSGTYETRKAMAQLSCLNLVNFFKSGKPLHKVI